MTRTKTVTLGDERDRLDALFKKAMTYPRFRRAWMRLLRSYR